MSSIGTVNIVLSGRLLRGVRRRARGSLVHVSLLFSDGIDYTIEPAMGEEITACLINTVRKAAPITKVTMGWPQAGEYELVFYADDYVLLIIRSTHRNDGGFPVTLHRRGDTRG